jgi:hypothetical protein
MVAPTAPVVPASSRRRVIGRVNAPISISSRRVGSLVQQAQRWLAHSTRRPALCKYDANDCQRMSGIARWGRPNPNDP